MKFKLSLFALLSIVTLSCIVAALEAKYSLLDQYTARIKRVGFGSELVILIIFTGLLALPRFSRRLKFWFRAGSDYTCPVCSGDVDAQRNQCKGCGSEHR